MENKIKIEDILENTPEEIEVLLSDGSTRTVLVRCPTTRDKIDSAREARKLAEGLPEGDIALEETKILALKMIVEPKVSMETYLDGNDLTTQVILDKVHMWYANKVKGINDRREKEIKAFLEQQKVR